MTVSTLSGVRWRQIGDDDLAGVAELLSRGFRFRSKRYWLRGLERQAARRRPDNSPKYGYVLLHGSKAVGAILMFSATVDAAHGPAVRCNLSSWYVEPKYRNYGSLLITAALRNKTTTYVNVSPAPHTWETVEAQGFAPYCLGEMVTLPILSPRRPGAAVEAVGENGAPDGAPAFDLLAEHARLGCLSLIVRHGGERFPFVFHRHRVFKRVLPCWRLIYCRDVADYVRFAGDLGAFLLRRGRPLVVVDADAPIPGLTGWHTRSFGRKYARGPNVPRLGDLAYTEDVFFN
jgi:hypothetical protein